MTEKESLFDVRTFERNIAEGLISDSDYKKFLKDLKDAESKAEFSEIDAENEGEAE